MQVNDDEEYDENGYPHNHLWLLVGDPPKDEVEWRVFECDCGRQVIEECAPGQEDLFPLDPFREAVGGVIQDVVVIELWLRSLSGHLLELETLDRDASDRRVKDMPPQQQISLIREYVPQVLTTEHAEAVVAALPEVESVLTARNHLVHGIWLPNADRTMYAAQKAGRRGNPFTEQRFTRRDLLRLHRRARKAAGSLHSVITDIINADAYTWDESD